MGSRPTREAHMMRYGATIESVLHPEGGWESKRPPTAAEQGVAMDRLAQPRSGGARRVDYVARSKSQQGNPMEDLFPATDDPAEVGDIPPDSSYPYDWRRQPTASQHAGVTWLYSWLPIAREADNANVFATACQMIDKNLAEHGVRPVNNLTSRREVREMMRSPMRFGVMFDLLATRRNVLSGSPHEIAHRLYRHVEERYPVYVKFMFVGITDNGTRRVARDVFSRTPQPGGAKKLGFDVVDTKHLYIVHPNGEDSAEMRRRGEEFRSQQAEDHRRRHCTPKFVPAPPPEWLERVESRLAASRLEGLHTPEGLRGGTKRAVSAATTGGASTTSSIWQQRPVVLEQCDRCWLFGYGGVGGGKADTAGRATEVAERLNEGGGGGKEDERMAGDDDGEEALSEAGSVGLALEAGAHGGHGMVARRNAPVTTVEVGRSHKVDAAAARRVPSPETAAVVVVGGARRSFAVGARTAAAASRSSSAATRGDDGGGLRLRDIPDSDDARLLGMLPRRSGRKEANSSSHRSTGQLAVMRTVEAVAAQGQPSLLLLRRQRSRRLPKNLIDSTRSSSTDAADRRPASSLEHMQTVARLIAERASLLPSPDLPAPIAHVSRMRERIEAKLNNARRLQ